MGFWGFGWNLDLVKFFEDGVLLPSLALSAVLRAGRETTWGLLFDKPVGRKDVAEAERAAAGAARPTGSQEIRDLAEFWKCHPPQFTGDADPEAVDRWICELEKIFAVLGCSPEKRLTYAVYMLVGEAEHWWRGTYQMLAARGVTVDWECFRTVFMEKYFPESVRHAKEAEFMRLHQGGMTISEYAMRFEHLAHFYSQGIAEAWKCRKFVDGLRYELKRVVTVEGPSGSKRGGNQRKPYDRPQPQQGGSVIRQPSGAAGGGRQGGGATLRCYRCVGPHFVRRADTQRSSVQRADTQKGDRPTTAGRVFALTGAEASTSSDLVKRKGKAAGSVGGPVGKAAGAAECFAVGCSGVIGSGVCVDAKQESGGVCFKATEES
ncbi:uncharacterized protein LOC109800292 [Cajanus cajan]|uniref:uncharacterized protein LOC109800292 n=1 Tax=Cajanus cajan TaxID=3821 RepID=UPI00098D8363|nr:uncharacterized protein LOC109800292 [Cajanus cajan]